MRLAVWFVALALVFLISGTFAGAQEDDVEYEYSLSIEEYLENALPPQEGRMINFNEVTGILTVTDTPSNQRLIKKLVKQFDVGPRQVLIEAKFVEISFEDLDELGIEWYWRKHGDIDIGETSPTLWSVSQQIESDIGATDLRRTSPILNPNWEGIQWDDSTSDTFPLTNFGLGFVISQYESGKFLTAYLRALASEDRANLLSSPKVTTLSGQMANIQITQTIPYVSEVDFENAGTAEDPIWQFEYTIEERVTGITLEVTPYVSANSNVITLDIHPEVSNLVRREAIYESDAANPFTSDADVPSLLGWPVIDTRTAQTSVIVSSGETIVMGGFIQDNEEVREKKVPILGDIPLVGNLFRYKEQEREKKNLVIFLTATLLDAEGRVATTE